MSAGAAPHRFDASQSRSLYVLTDEWARIQAVIDNDDGEIPIDLESEIDRLGGEITAKAEAICKILGTLEHRALAREAEIHRLRTLATADRNAHSRLKLYLKTCLEAAGLKRLQTPLFSLSVCNNSQPAIRYTGEIGSLPQHLRRVVVEPDTLAAREQYREFGSLPAGWEVTHGNHLRIK